MEKLKFLESNRLLNRKHINEIKESISKNGYITHLPIIVNKNNEIIDGQHRYIACKEMGIDAPIAKIESDISLLIQLNTTQKKWVGDNYIHYFSKQGNKTYKNLEQFSNNLKLKHSVSLTIILNGVLGGSLSDKIKEGELKIEDWQFKNGYSCAEKIISTIKLMRLPVTDRLVRALVLAKKEKYFTFDTLLLKLSYQQDKVYKCSTTSGYLKMIEDIYNNKNHKKITLVR